MDLRVAGLGSFAILVILLGIRLVVSEARVLPCQSCIPEQVGWPWGGQCRLVPWFPQRGRRTIASNCCEVIQYSRMRKDVGVHQTKGQKLLYCHLSTDLHHCCYSAMCTVTWQGLVGVRNRLDAPLSRNCLKNPYC